MSTPRATRAATLVFCRDAVIDGYDERGVALLGDAREGGRGETVTLVEPVRNERVDRCSQHAQCLGEQACRRDAVDIEIAKYRNGLPRIESTLDAVGDI